MRAHMIAVEHLFAGMVVLKVHPNVFWHACLDEGKVPAVVKSKSHLPAHDKREADVYLVTFDVGEGFYSGVFMRAGHSVLVTIDEFAADLARASAPRVPAFVPSSPQSRAPRSQAPRAARGGAPGTPGSKRAA